MWEAVGAKVSRLIRVRYGSVILPRLLRPKHTEDVDREQLYALYHAVGLKPPVPTSRSVQRGAGRRPSPSSRAPRNRRAKARRT